MLMFLLTILVFLLVLSILVIIHEAGHFFVAKFFGIKVEEFGFGFPPRALGKKKGETEYTLNWLPIGGFVKLYGEDEAGGGSISTSTKHLEVKNIKRAFFSRPVWQRASVVVAGVVMNMLLGIAIFYVFLGASGYKTILPHIGNYKFFAAHQKNIDEGVIISEVASNSPAAQAGLLPKARVLSVNGKKIDSQETMLTEVNKNRGKEIAITWQDPKTKLPVTRKITPRVHPPKGEGSMGIQFEFSPLPLMIISYETPTEKLFSGATLALNTIPWQIEGLGALISKAMQEKTAAPVADAVSGPVGIGFAVGSILQIPDAKAAILQLLQLAGIMSMALAFFNVLPIPALDGGRLFFILIEGIIGKKLNPKVEAAVHNVGFAVLLGLIILITVHDVFRYALPAIAGLKIF